MLYYVTKLFQQLRTIIFLVLGHNGLLEEGGDVWCSTSVLCFFSIESIVAAAAADEAYSLVPQTCGFSQGFILTFKQTLAKLPVKQVITVLFCLFFRF